MIFLGVEFAPLNVPLERRLQTLAAAAWFLSFTLGGSVIYFIWFCLLFTKFWWLVPPYLAWIYLDRNTCETGGRPSNWMKKWAWWYHLKNYYPSRLLIVPEFTLDPNRNYIFSCFPHGILPVGPFSNIQSHSGDFYGLYPNFNVYTSVIELEFYMPLTRELALAGGCVSCSAKSLNYVFSRPEKGQIVLLWPGGALEAYNSRPGKYKIVVKNRKGFVKMALRNGCSLVPVITFGECDVFDQVEGPILRRIQEYLRKFLGVAPAVINGRGFFQYSFGMIPRRKPVTTVVGAPIEVTKEENPTDEQIDELHKKFIQQLQNLFDDYKYKCVDNPENTHLELQ